LKEIAADFLIQDIICKYCAFSQLISDRGVQFRAQLSQAIYERLAIRQLTTTSFHPQTNGRIEKFNQTLAKMMTAYCNKSQDLWDKNIQLVVFAYNTSVHAATGYTPFKLLFGRDVVISPDQTLHSIRTCVESEAQYLNSLEKGVKEVYEIENSNIEKSAKRNKYYYDQKRRNVSYNLGDMVMVLNPTRFKGLSEKLLTQFHGPLTIIKCYSNGLNYEVEGIRNVKKFVVD
jgi:putative transposase